MLIYNQFMKSLWDYNKSELEKTEEGKIKLLERKINYGMEKGDKIRIADMKKYWEKLHLFPLNQRLMELLLWGTNRSSRKNRKSSFMK